MKLSNKLLIGLFGGGLLYLIAGFTEARFRADLRGFDGADIQIETVPLNDLKYLIISELDENIYIQSSPSPRIEVKSKEGDMLKKMEYDLLRDTLILKKLPDSEELNFNIVVYVPETGFKGLNANQAYVRFSKMDLTSLSIIQNGGRLTFDRNIDLERLDLTAFGSAVFNSYGMDLDSLNLNVDKSELYIYTEIDHLDGTLMNESRLLLESVNNISFKKDNSSRMTLQH